MLTYDADCPHCALPLAIEEDGQIVSCPRCDNESEAHIDTLSINGVPATVVLLEPVSRKYPEES